MRLQKSKKNKASCFVILNAHAGFGKDGITSSSSCVHGFVARPHQITLHHIKLLGTLCSKYILEQWWCISGLFSSLEFFYMAYTFFWFTQNTPEDVKKSNAIYNTRTHRVKHERREKWSKPNPGDYSELLSIVCSDNTEVTILLCCPLASLSYFFLFLNVSNMLAFSKKRESWYGKSVFVCVSMNWRHEPLGQIR